MPKLGPVRCRHGVRPAGLLSFGSWLHDDAMGGPGQQGRRRADCQDTKIGSAVFAAARRAGCSRTAEAPGGQAGRAMSDRERMERAAWWLSQGFELVPVRP